MSLFLHLYKSTHYLNYQRLSPPSSLITKTGWRWTPCPSTRIYTMCVCAARCLVLNVGIAFPQMVDNSNSSASFVLYQHFYNMSQIPSRLHEYELTFMSGGGGGGWWRQNGEAGWLPRERTSFEKAFQHSEVQNHFRFLMKYRDNLWPCLWQRTSQKSKRDLLLNPDHMVFVPKP